MDVDEVDLKADTKEAEETQVAAEESAANDEPEPVVEGLESDGSFSSSFLSSHSLIPLSSSRSSRLASACPRPCPRQASQPVHLPPQERPHRRTSSSRLSFQAWRIRRRTCRARVQEPTTSGLDATRERRLGSAWPPQASQPPPPLPSSHPTRCPHLQPPNPRRRRTLHLGPRSSPSRNSPRTSHPRPLPQQAHDDARDEEACEERPRLPREDPNRNVGAREEERCDQSCCRGDVGGFFWTRVGSGDAARTARGGDAGAGGEHADDGLVDEGRHPVPAAVLWELGLGGREGVRVVTSCSFLGCDL